MNTNADYSLSSSLGSVHLSENPSTQESLPFFFSSSLLTQEQLLKNQLEFTKKLQEVATLDFFHLPYFLENFFLQNISFLTNKEQGYPHTVQFFFAIIGHMLKKNTWPWSLIQGKSFLSHLKSYQEILPSHLGIAQYLNSFDKETLELFEEVVYEKLKINPIVDKEEKLQRLNILKVKAQKLVEKAFPGALFFIEEIEREQETHETYIEIVKKIDEQLESSSLSQKEKIQILAGWISSNFSLRETLLGYLVTKDNFEAISLFLSSLSGRFWSYRIFKEICLEKAQNIEGGKPSVKVSDTSEWVAVAWNNYYLSPDCIFRNENLFTPAQIHIIDTLMQEKVIKLLFLYMVTTLQDTCENHLADTNKAFMPGTPVFLNRLKQQKHVLLPLALTAHAIGLLVEPNGTLSLYNTGWGLRGNHPESTDGIKYQTYLRKKNVPLTALFNETLWQKIRAMRDSNDPDQLYKLIMEGLGHSGSQELLSNHPVDYEAIQNSETCIFQHIQAILRDQFMQCEKLGDKEARYVIYKIVMADFMLFVGKERFLLEKQPNEHELFETWQEKKEKLDAISDLAKTVNRNEREDVLEYLYKEITFAKSPEGLNSTTLGKAYALYWKNRHARTIAFLKTTPLDKLPKLAAFNLKYSLIKEGIENVVQERLSNNQELMEKYKKQLIRYGISSKN